ncbi:hypothetical protein CALVIDRAFT_200490 [Calocera viscosa TUFC12733]|uniref:Uncharacterized protein n=1 Tax=Calocera viscosa (strain TUFC12733) TaxID=1330018 RepID=A0A167KLI6_CALVF|nr:hypothetical protein CALVIDRAFT_200490 [Calocera viscosa TUFC12733]
MLDPHIGTQLVPSGDGKWQIRYPIVPAHTPQPMTCIKDIGPAVVAAIGAWEDEGMRERLTKGPVVLCSYTITGEEMAQTVARGECFLGDWGAADPDWIVTGKEVTYIPITLPEPFKTVRPPPFFYSQHGADDVAEVHLLERVLVHGPDPRTGANGAWRAVSLV